MTHIKRNNAIGPWRETAAALRPETDYDTRETALWLNNLLYCIHEKVR
jgi:hypothetical protein